MFSTIYGPPELSILIFYYLNTKSVFEVQTWIE